MNKLFGNVNRCAEDCSAMSCKTKPMRVKYQHFRESLLKRVKIEQKLNVNDPGASCDYYTDMFCMWSRGACLLFIMCGLSCWWILSAPQFVHDKNVILFFLWKPYRERMQLLIKNFYQHSSVNISKITNTQEELQVIIETNTHMARDSYYLKYDFFLKDITC